MSALPPCPCTQLPPPTDEAELRVCRTRNPSPGRRALICLPPGPGIGHQILRSLHQSLADLGTVTLVDYPGHGGSKPAADLDDFLGRIGGLLQPDDVLLGHSWGAAVAAEVAARTGHRRLVLMNPPPATESEVVAVIPNPATSPASSSSQATPVTASRRRWSPSASEAVVAARTGGSDAAGYRRFLLGHAVPLGFAGDRQRAADLMRGVPDYPQAWRQLRTWPVGTRTAAAVRAAEARGAQVLLIYAEQDPLADRALAGAGESTKRHTVVVPGQHYCYVDAPSVIHNAVARYLKELE